MIGKIREHQCSRCKKNPVDLNLVHTGGKANKKDYQLCEDCFCKMNYFLSGGRL